MLALTPPVMEETLAALTAGVTVDVGTADPDVIIAVSRTAAVTYRDGSGKTVTKPLDEYAKQRMTELYQCAAIHCTTHTPPSGMDPTCAER